MEKRKFKIFEGEFTKYAIVLILCLFLLGCDNEHPFLGATPWTLRVIEKDGIFVVQRYDRLF